MQVGSHLLNKDSSRSHSIMQVQVTSREMVTVGDGSEQLVETHGRLSFVDLAGSERLDQSGSHGKGAKETMHINSSLLVLGKVISALSAAGESGRAGHVPYRDSKLTKLLADSLGGSSLAMMIGCVSPSTGAAEESANTLHYLSAAKRIQNRPVVQLNQGSGTAGVIKSLRDELQGLRVQNSQLSQQLMSVSSSGLSQGSGRTTPQGAHPEMQHPGMLGPMARTQSVPEQQLQSMQRAEQTIEHMSAELQHVRRQNAHLAMANNLLQRSYADVKRENDALLEKLERLERVFIDRNDQ